MSDESKDSDLFDSIQPVNTKHIKIKIANEDIVDESGKVHLLKIEDDSYESPNNNNNNNRYNLKHFLALTC